MLVCNYTDLQTITQEASLNWSHEFYLATLCSIGPINRYHRTRPQSIASHNNPRGSPGGPGLNYNICKWLSTHLFGSSETLHGSSSPWERREELIRSWSQRNLSSTSTISEVGS